MFPLSLLGKLPEPALVLYARLQYFKGPAADSCFVYRSTLARELGWSLDKVDRNVDRLKKAGLIKTERRGQGKENLYVFLYCSLLDGAVNTASMSPQIRADESADLRLPFKEEKNTERSTTELASARATQTTGQGREGKAENKQGADEEATATAETTITVTVPAALPAEKPHVDALQRHWLRWNRR